MPKKMPKARLVFLLLTAAVSTLGGMRMLLADNQASRASAQDPFPPDASGSFFGSTRSAPELPALPVQDPMAAPLPDWSSRQAPSAESQFAWALLQIATKPADVAKSVTGTLGAYVQEKQKQMRQEDLVKKFYINLDYVLSGFHLQPLERDELTVRVKQVYIEDGQNSRYRLDTLHFRELPYIARMQYGEMMLGRTRDGIVDTFYPGGVVKTRWTLQNGKPVGVVTTYYENGEILYQDYYKNGQKNLRKKFNAEGKLEFEQKYDYASSETPGASEPVAAAPPIVRAVDSEPVKTKNDSPAEKTPANGAVTAS